MDKKIKELLKKLINLWMPRNLESEDIRIALTPFVGVQFNSSIIALILIPLMISFQGLMFAKCLFIYFVLIYVSLFLLRFNFIDSALYLGSVNVSLLILAGGILLGPKSNVWVYYIGIFIGNNFFISYKRKVRIVGNTVILSCFTAYLIANWFQWYSGEIPIEREKSIIRFGNFNMLYALLILISFVSYFHKEMTEIRKKLEMQANALSDQLSLISNILNNIRQSIFAIDVKKKIVAPVSLYSQKIFNKNIENLSVSNLFYQRVDSQINEQESIFNSTLDLIMGEDNLNWEFSKSNLPSEIDIEVDHSIKNLKLAYSEMRDQNQNLEKLLFVVEDVTEFKKLDNQFKIAQQQDQKEILIFSQVFNKDPKQLNSYFQSSNRQLDGIKNIFSVSDFLVNETEIKKLKGILHTFKGNSRALGFSILSSAIHDFESFIVNKENLQDGLKNDLQNCQYHFSIISNEYSEYCKIISQLKKFDEFNLNSSKKRERVDDYYSIYKNNFERFKDKILELIKDQHKLTFQQFEYELLRMSEIPLGEIIRSKKIIIDEVSIVKNKKVEFEFNEDHITVSSKIAEVLDDVLTHLLRNAVVHGLENESQRLKKNKSETGRVVINFTSNNDELLLRISDDGQGIDFNFIKEFIINQKIKTKDEINIMTENDILNLIFKLGVSTAKSIDEYSGRGTGLEFVKSSIESINGSISVKSKLGVGTEFNIKIPFNSSHSDLNIAI